MLDGGDFLSFPLLFGRLMTLSVFKVEHDTLGGDILFSRWNLPPATMMMKLWWRLIFHYEPRLQLLAFVFTFTKIRVTLISPPNHPRGVTIREF